MDASRRERNTRALPASRPDTQRSIPERAAVDRPRVARVPDLDLRLRGGQADRQRPVRDGRAYVPRDKRHPRRRGLLLARHRHLRDHETARALGGHRREDAVHRAASGLSSEAAIATRLYIASDLHAAEKAWRKFVNAIVGGVYKADVALLAGDLTGKAIVPIVTRDGHYDTELLGVHRSARNDEELATLERDIADVGYYSFVTSTEEADELSRDEAGRHELLGRLMTERVQSWLQRAGERLADSPVPIYLIPGNDDDFAIDEVLNEPQFV